MATNKNVHSMIVTNCVHGSCFDRTKREGTFVEDYFEKLTVSTYKGRTLNRMGDVCLDLMEERKQQASVFREGTRAIIGIRLSIGTKPNLRAVAVSLQGTCSRPVRLIVPISS